MCVKKYKTGKHRRYVATRKNTQNQNKDGQIAESYAQDSTHLSHLGLALLGGRSLGFLNGGLCCHGSCGGLYRHGDEVVVVEGKGVFQRVCLGYLS